jgi:hypothetical protein
MHRGERQRAEGTNGATVAHGGATATEGVVLAATTSDADRPASGETGRRPTSGETERDGRAGSDQKADSGTSMSQPSSSWALARRSATFGGTVRRNQRAAATLPV